jgi:hypothetical protein
MAMKYRTQPPSPIHLNGNDSECYGYETLTPCWFPWLEGRGSNYGHNMSSMVNKNLTLSTTDETLVVEMRIWCIKIGNVFALHYKVQNLILDKHYNQW